MRQITIYYSENIPTEIRRVVEETIHTTFNLDYTTTTFNPQEIEFSFDKIREQYNAGKILKYFAYKTKDFLVIVDKDVFVGNLNFVFGVAYIGIGAVISTYTLNMSADKNLFLERLEKTVKHELGHYFGLKHCKNKCVMRYANSLYELDRKHPEFCEKCRLYLQKEAILKER